MSTDEGVEGAAVGAVELIIEEAEKDKEAGDDEQGRHTNNTTDAALRPDPGRPPLQLRFSRTHVEVFGDCSKTQAIKAVLMHTGWRYEGKPRYLWKKAFVGDEDRAEVVAEVQELCSRFGLLLVMPQKDSKESGGCGCGRGQRLSDRCVVC